MLACRRATSAISKNHSKPPAALYKNSCRKLCQHAAFMLTLPSLWPGCVHSAYVSTVKVKVSYVKVKLSSCKVNTGENK